MRKILAVLILVILSVYILIGCNSDDNQLGISEDSNGAAADTSVEDEGENKLEKEEPYHATLMYLVASDASDQEAVSEAINKLTMRELNMTVDLLPVTIGTYMQQIQLMLTSGEPLDVFPMFANFAGTYVDAELVVNMRDLIEMKGQDILKIVGREDVWCSSIGDFLWGVTTMRERANPLGLVVRTDILEETGISVESIKTMEDITGLFEKVNELHPEMTCYGGASGMGIPQLIINHDSLGDDFGVLEDMGQALTVTNRYESEVFMDQVKVMRDWYLKGYTSQDMPTSTDPGEFLMRAGNLFSFSVYVKPNSKAEKDAMTGYDTTIIQLSQPLLTTTATAGVDYAIANNSENPEKAMELLNFLFSNPEINNLMNWGIEGEHYQVTDNGTIDYPEGITNENCGYHQDFGWALPNQFIGYVWKGNEPDVFDSYVDMRNSAVVSKAYGFTFDYTSVVNEVAAVTSVTDQYLAAICTGSVDPETMIAEFNEALYDSGLQVIIDSKQGQLDAWLSRK